MWVGWGLHLRDEPSYLCLLGDKACTAPGKELTRLFQTWTRVGTRGARLPGKGWPRDWGG